MTSAATPRDDDEGEESEPPSPWTPTRDEEADEAIRSAVSLPPDPRTSAVLERQHEAELFAELVRVKFDGPVWDPVAEELAVYAGDVLTGWMCTRTLGTQLAEKGIRFYLTFQETEDLATDEDHRNSVVDYACYEALQKFREKARLGQGWQPGQGAALATWITTAALFEVINQIKNWRNWNQRFLDACKSAQNEANRLDNEDPRSRSDLAEIIANRTVLKEKFQSLPTAQDQNIVWGRACKYTFDEIAQLDGTLDGRAVQRRWNVLKAKYDWVKRLDEKEQR